MTAMTEGISCDGAAVGCRCHKKDCSREYPLRMHNGSLVSDGKHGYRARNIKKTTHIVTRIRQKLKVCVCG